MTVLDRPTQTTDLGTPRLLAGHDLTDHDEHRRHHGRLLLTDQDTLVAATRATGLLGRGGAAFPVAVKLSGTAPGPRTEVVVNLSEGEPASHKDRVLATTAPHLVLDGALLVAAALGTRHVTVSAHDPEAGDALATAAAQRPDARDVVVRRTTGGFVGGEVRALLRGIEGGPAVPPGRRTLPTIAGLRGRPTFVSNTETFAHLGLLGTHGPQWFGEVGTATERGTTLLTLLGGASGPVVVEAAMGTSLRALLGADAGPVVVGGYHGTWLAEPGDLVLDRAVLRAQGVHLGAGVLARVPASTCALAEAAAVARWLADQSAGQCGPCFFGLPAVADDVGALVHGTLPAHGLHALQRRLGTMPGRGACAHPDGASQFVRSALAVLQTEIAEHLAHGGCGRSYRGVLPVAQER